MTEALRGPASDQTDPEAGLDQGLGTTIETLNGPEGELPVRSTNAANNAGVQTDPEAGVDQGLGTTTETLNGPEAELPARSTNASNNAGVQTDPESGITRTGRHWWAIIWDLVNFVLVSSSSVLAIFFESQKEEAQKGGDEEIAKMWRNIAFYMSIVWGVFVPFIVWRYKPFLLQNPKCIIGSVFVIALFIYIRFDVQQAATMIYVPLIANLSMVAPLPLKALWQQIADTISNTLTSPSDADNAEYPMTSLRVSPLSDEVEP